MFARPARIQVNPLSNRLLTGTAFSDQQDWHGTVAKFPNHSFYCLHARTHGLNKRHVRETDVGGDGQTWSELVEVLFHEMNLRPVRGGPFALR
jgi:hypothetical protein